MFKCWGGPDIANGSAQHVETLLYSESSTRNKKDARGPVSNVNDIPEE